MDLPRILLSGTSSRVGKTMISIGLMRALFNRGYKVQPYKVGPDFIDPSFHYFATGRYSRNLDSFMMNRENILEVFQRNFKDADLAVIEGKTGLYDSHDALNEKGSTAEVSKFLQCPTILVANAERLSRTAAALVMGYKVFDPEVNIEGAILNRVGGARHSNKVRKAVEKLSGMGVLGTIPRQDIIIPDRHLGLIPAFEREEEFKELFDGLAEVVEKFVDVDKIIEMARKAPCLEKTIENPVFNPVKVQNQINLGVFRDKTFNFYYQDNIDAFAATGANIKFIDSLNDKKLPSVDALYIGGGFPEIFAHELENNSSLRKEVFNFCHAGKPVYAECGGLMYLGESLKLINGEEYEMVGFLPIKTQMFHKFQALGYSVYKAIDSNIISRKGDTLLGHEFHYSRVAATEKLDYVFKVKRGRGVIGDYDGIVKNRTLANYLHIHVTSYPQMINRFIKEAVKTKK